MFMVCLWTKKMELTHLPSYKKLPEFSSARSLGSLNIVFSCILYKQHKFVTLCMSICILIAAASRICTRVVCVCQCAFFSFEQPKHYTYDIYLNMGRPIFQLAILTEFPPCPIDIFPTAMHKKQRSTYMQINTASIQHTILF